MTCDATGTERRGLEWHVANLPTETGGGGWARPIRLHRGSLVPEFLITPPTEAISLLVEMAVVPNGDSVLRVLSVGVVRERDGSKRASKWAYLRAEVFKEVLVWEVRSNVRRGRAGKGKEARRYRPSPVLDVRSPRNKHHCHSNFVLSAIVREGRHGNIRCLAHRNSACRSRRTTALVCRVREDLMNMTDSRGRLG